MKKIILLTALCLSAVSCVVDYGYNSQRTAYNLQRYINAMETNTIVYSVNFMSALLDINKYLTLTDEEKKADPLYYNVEDAEENYYAYNDGSLRMNIYTEGKNLADDDPVSWKVAPLTGAGWNYLAGARYSGWEYYDASSRYEKGTLATVTRLAANQWEIIVKNESETTELLKFKISCAPAAEQKANTAGKLDYTISDLNGCVLPDREGYYVEFNVEDDIVGSMKYDLRSLSFKRTYAGKLYLEIFDNKSKRLDWCRMTLDDDSYETSLD